MGQLEHYNDKYIVVTGAAGFIGSGVVRKLNDFGHENLIVVDDLKKVVKWKNLVGKKFANIIPRQELFAWLEDHQLDIGAIIHLGACSNTAEIDADFLLNNNYRYSVRLAQCAAKNNVRFIYASSAATYGDGTLGFSDEEDIDRLKPMNMYGYSKQLFDQWIKREKLLEKVVGLKYFNVFGPNEYHKGRMASTILHFTRQIIETGRVRLFKSNDPQYKNGEQCRDFIYVKDAVEMTCRFLDDKYKDVVGLYNIGNGKAQTWNELATNVFRSLGKTPAIDYIDIPQDLVKQYQNYTCADMNKLKQVYSERGDILTMMPFNHAIEDYVTQYILKGERW